MGEEIRTAIVLCGGRPREPLVPLIGDRTPAELAPMDAQRPFLGFVLDRILDLGTIERIVLCTGYRGYKIRYAFGSEYVGVPVLYAHEHRPHGTGGALGLAWELLQSIGIGPEDPCLVAFGDRLVTGGALEIRQHFLASRSASVVLGLTAVHRPAAQQIIRTDLHGKVTQIGSGLPIPTIGWVSAGLSVARSRVLNISIPPAGSIYLWERGVLPAWVGHGVYAFPLLGTAYDIGQRDGLLRARLTLGETTPTDPRGAP